MAFIHPARILHHAAVPTSVHQCEPFDTWPFQENMISLLSKLPSPSPALLIGVLLTRTVFGAGPVAWDDTDARTLLEDNCFDCHAGDQHEGNLQLDELLADLDERPKTAGIETQSFSGQPLSQQWWSVLKNVRAGTMPPPDSGYELDAPETRRLRDWVKYSALNIIPQATDPGSVTLRRLNRREYAATIRDLMGIDFNADIVFPEDDTGFGFDTVGDVLGFSPMTIEKYLASAKQIVDEAVPRQTTIVPVPVSINDISTEKGEPADKLLMSQPADINLQFEISQTAQYQLKLLYQTDGSFEFCRDRCELKIMLDDQPIHRQEYGWDENRDWTIDLPRELAAGKHTVAFEVRPTAPANAQEGETDSPGGYRGRSYLRINALVVEGPIKAGVGENPPGYERFFHRNQLPASQRKLRGYANEVLARFTLRAFRRPAAAKTVERLVGIAEQVYQAEDKTFEDGIAAAMMSVLASPRFLLRFEEIEPRTPPDESYPLIDEYALASRLSYLLWSSMPDQELFDLAAAGKLRSSLDKQLTRMLSDEKSSAFIDGFVSQWLRTADIEKVQIDSLAAFGLREDYDRHREEFGELRRIDDPSEEQQERLQTLRAEFDKVRKYRDLFGAETRSAMRQETQLLLEHVIRRRRPLNEIIDPGYTFVNEHLAKLYELEGVTGKQMRRVKLPANSKRGGILTHGTMLTVTSNPTRTSPVKRGLYVLENILGTPTPPAPPNVPELEQSKDRFGGREPTLRELLAVHRESSLCTSCHSRMDPLGLALENYNALGLWRSEEFGQPIQSAGQLITGEKFEDIVQLRRILANERKADFYRCLTEKLITYALGRGIEYYDEHTCDEIVDVLLDGNDDFGTLLSQVVHSPAFQRSRR